MNWRKLFEFVANNGPLVFILALVLVAFVYGLINPQTHESFEYRGQEAPESGN